MGGACVKDSINYNNEKIFYPKGATVLGMMQKFIFDETGLSNYVETFYPKTPKLVYFPDDKEPTRIFQNIKDSFSNHQSCRPSINVIWALNLSSSY